MPTSTRVFRNASVRSGDKGDVTCAAIAWRDGRILAVGTDAEVALAAGPGAESWDVAGAAVLPGFIDAHHHPCIVALFGGVLRLTAPAVTDIPSLQRALAELSKTTAPGDWVVATEWDEINLTERRPPTREELDDAVPGHPLIAFHYTCHRAVANSRALELAGIGRDTSDPSGGEFVRGRDRLPTGLLIERGMSPVERLARASLVARDADGFMSRLAEHHRALAKAGITRVFDATVPGDLAVLYREAERRGLLSVPTVMMPVSTTGYLETPFDALDGPVTGETQGLLTVGPMKLVFDGAPGCAMCLGWIQTAGAFLRSLAQSARRGSLDTLRTMMSVEPRVGVKLRTGIQIYRQDEAREIVTAAVERGFALATHAIGNQAVELALDTYDAAGAKLGRAGVPRLEHATFLTSELVARIAGIGAAVVTQPNFMSLPAYSTAVPIPGLRNAPLRWLLDAKVLVAGSSDFPVAGFDPLAAIVAAVTRKTARGEVYEADQRIEIDEAIALYTSSAAEVTGCLAEVGTLSLGKRADLVVIDGSVATLEGLEAAKVRATVIGGEIVYGQP